MQKITPMLWFDNQAEDAAEFYTSIFKNSKNGSEMGNVTRYSDEAAKASGRPKGSAMTASFQLDGQDFVALNGGPHFKFTEAVSFVVNCETQEELDYFWEKLTAGGKEVECGWLKDKFGLSWQVVPTILPQLIGGGDPEKSGRVMKALMQMKKLDIGKLKAAAENK